MNQIDLDDIKLWIGELVIENKLLQKKIAQIEIELIRLKNSSKTKSDILQEPDVLHSRMDRARANDIEKRN